MRPWLVDHDFHALTDDTEHNKKYKVMMVPSPNVLRFDAVIAQFVVITVGGMTGIFHDPHLKPINKINKLYLDIYIFVREFTHV